MQPSNINKLVSLSFDEDPEVRKQAAKSLGELDDPAASFALVELSFDKDPSVRVVAQQYLDKRKHSEPDLVSFANIFATGAKKDQSKETEPPPADAREKVLRPITRIFEKRLGKEKAEAVKSKMMPTIEKIYLNSVQHQSSKKKSDESGRKAMQEFLTSYLEVISDIDQIGGASQHAEAPEEPAHEPAEARPTVESAREPPEETKEVREPLAGELEEVGRETKLDNVSSEIVGVETQESVEIREEEEIAKLPDTFFKKAYETMMLSGGDDELMHREMKKMLQDAEREITLAFKLAKRKFKEIKITNITKIRDGMRNINTEPLVVKSVENLQYQKTKRQAATLTRVLVNDETGNEGVIYLFDGRGTELKPQMHVKVVRGMAKSFDFSGETALVLGKKGNVYIVL